MERAAEAEMSPSVWVTGYVDQSRKCGFGFLLSDQSVSVGFNDGTSMVLEPTGVAFDYINRTRPSSMAEAGADKREETIRTRHTIKDFPLELKRKVHLLKDFRSYVHKLAKCKEGKALGRVDGGRSSTTSAQQHGGTVGEPLMFVEQFRRTPQMILFRLSNRTVQVVFSDKTEVLLSEEARLLTYVDTYGRRETFTPQRVLEDNRMDIIERVRSSNLLLDNVLEES